MNIEVHIEIPKNTHVKYEYDHENDKLICDRVLHTPFTYPFNYGYIPNTLAGDGDPLDAVVVMHDPLISNCYIECKIVGALITEDEKGMDEKLIMVPSDKVDPSSKTILDINDIHETTKEKIKFFYEHYKKLEPNKWVKVTGYVNRETAEEIYKKSCK